MTKLQMYRKLKQEFANIQSRQSSDPNVTILSDEERDGLAMEELSVIMGTSEALLSSIIASPAKSQLNKQKTPKVPEDAEFIPITIDGRASPIPQRVSFLMSPKSTTTSRPLISPTPIDVKLDIR